MEKLFGDKKITIRVIKKSDLKNAKKFCDFINGLVAEDAKISINEKVGLKDEQEFIKNILKGAKSKNKVFLLAEAYNKIIAVTNIELEKLRRNHIGSFGIMIDKDYRGIGLGKYLMSEIIELAKNDLKQKPKIIQLEVFTNNKPAIELYKKMGFKTVGKIPKQLQYKGKLLSTFMMMREI